MKYGVFNDTAREYVIATPKTPLPWINYLGSRDFFVSFRTRRAVIVSIKMQNCFV